jgi:hypothetical protein
MDNWRLDIEQKIQISTFDVIRRSAIIAAVGSQPEAININAIITI